jgi:CheY-like chemotaxis protein
VPGGDGKDVSLADLLAEVLETAMATSGSSRGNVQIFDPSAGTLHIAAHHGFDAEFLQHFAVVVDDGSACGRAANDMEQVVVEDVERDDSFVPHRAIARSAGFRAVQSTPLVRTSGVLVGMVSTHFPSPHRPSAHVLAQLNAAGRVFGERIATHRDFLGARRQADVLVVDDNASVRTSLAGILRQAGYSVAEAGDGLDALEYVEAGSARVLLLDISMPRLDGIEFLDRLAAPPPAILISAVVDTHEVDHLDGKVLGHLRKPVNPPDLLALVARALEDEDPEAAV